MAVNPIPDGYRNVTPYLIVDGADRAIEFYKQAFGAKERMRFPMPGGKIGHAELEIGDSLVMLADEMPEMGYVSPKSAGGTPVSLMVYDVDVDARVARAVGAGAVVTREVKDEFYGDRIGTLTDPFGHVWSIATHKEEVSVEEMQRRMAAMA